MDMRKGELGLKRKELRKGRGKLRDKKKLRIYNLQ